MGRTETFCSLQLFVRKTRCNDRMRAGQPGP